jgi:hypothetical protein
MKRHTYRAACSRQAAETTRRHDPATVVPLDLQIASFQLPLGFDPVRKSIAWSGTPLEVNLVGPLGNLLVRGMGGPLDNSGTAALGL